jgi:hypothetical protein
MLAGEIPLRWSPGNARASLPSFSKPGQLGQPKNQRLKSKTAKTSEAEVRDVQETTVATKDVDEHVRRELTVISRQKRKSPARVPIRWTTRSPMRDSAGLLKSQAGEIDPKRPSSLSLLELALGREFLA